MKKEGGKKKGGEKRVWRRGTTIQADARLGYKFFWQRRSSPGRELSKKGLGRKKKLRGKRPFLGLRAKGGIKGAC